MDHGARDLRMVELAAAGAQRLALRQREVK
jgi:hypothetical protein